MDYEKAYKEALAKAREIHRNEDEKRFDMEWLFSELKESEDERIRKELINVFSNREKYLIDQSFGDITVSEALAWLEKQGEQKQEWSDEDEFRLSRIVENIELLNDANGNILLKDIEWLKSLKDRVQGKEEKK